MMSLAVYGVVSHSPNPEQMKMGGAASCGGGTYRVQIAGDRM